MNKLPKRVQELIDELYEVQNLTNKKKVDELVRTIHASMTVADQGGVMHVESMVASTTKNPMVVFEWGSNRGELTPVEARQYALQILQAAEGGVQDASLFRIITGEEMKLEPAHAFAIIGKVREARRKFEGGENEA